MKLGMLGIDARIAAVAAAAIRRGDSVVLAVDVSPEAFPGASVVDDQSLLDPAACDAVLVGSDDWSGERAEAVRLLVQAGRPLLVSHPLELSMLWAWEVEMIRRDINGVLVPLLPERLHPFVARLRQLLEASLAGGGLLGDVESVVLERRLTLRSREAVLRAVARDADLVRVLAGEPARMSALGVTPDTDPANWHSLVVGFSGPTSVPVRWQTTSGGCLELSDPHACWAMRRRTFIGSREVRHGAWRNDRVLRLFNRTTAGFKPLPVHEEVESGRRPKLLPGSILHYSYATSSDVLARAVRYAPLKAAIMRRKGQQPQAWSLPFRGLAAFLGSYLVRGGWRDGAAGFVVALSRVVDSTLPRVILLLDEP
jgi:hypothetical protein